jgi:hypothetical protein
LAKTPVVGAKTLRLTVDGRSVEPRKEDSNQPKEGTKNFAAKNLARLRRNQKKRFNRKEHKGAKNKGVTTKSLERQRRKDAEIGK